MYVCLCNRVTDRQLVEAAAELASGSDAGDAPSFARHVADRLGAGLGCGSCREFALDLVQRAATRHVSVMLPDAELAPVALDALPARPRDLPFQRASAGNNRTAASRGE